MNHILSNHELAPSKFYHKNILKVKDTNNMLYVNLLRKICKQINCFNENEYKAI